jgi:hypothetical protein
MKLNAFIILEIVLSLFITSSALASSPYTKITCDVVEQNQVTAATQIEIYLINFGVEVYLIQGNIKSQIGNFDYSDYDSYSYQWQQNLDSFLFRLSRASYSPHGYYTLMELSFDIPAGQGSLFIDSTETTQLALSHCLGTAL